MARVELFGLPGAGKTTLAKRMPKFALSNQLSGHPDGYDDLYRMGVDLIEQYAPGTSKKLLPRLRDRCNWSAMMDQQDGVTVLDEGLLQWGISLYIRTQNADGLQVYLDAMPLPHGAVACLAPADLIHRRNIERGTPERWPLAKKAMPCIPIITGHLSHQLLVLDMSEPGYTEEARQFAR